MKVWWTAPLGVRWALVCGCMRASLRWCLVLTSWSHGFRRYKSPEEIIDTFYPLRLEFYSKRKAYMLQQLTEAWSKLDNKMRFISMVRQRHG
jgi:hypothetical protein